MAVVKANSLEGHLYNVWVFGIDSRLESVDIATAANQAPKFPRFGGTVDHRHDQKENMSKGITPAGGQRW